MVGGEDRWFEGADAGGSRVAEVLEREEVLDRAQQREVVVGFLALRAGLYERREQQRADLAASASGQRRRPGARGREIGKARLTAARARIGQFAARGRLIGRDHQQPALFVCLRAQDHGHHAPEEAVSGRKARRRPAGARRRAPVVAAVGCDVGEGRRALGLDKVAAKAG